jgi:hypothetical protein
VEPTAVSGLIVSKRSDAWTRLLKISSSSRLGFVQCEVNSCRKNRFGTVVTISGEYGHTLYAPLNDRSPYHTVMITGTYPLAADDISSMSTWGPLDRGMSGHVLATVVLVEHLSIPTIPPQSTSQLIPTPSEQCEH